MATGRATPKTPANQKQKVELDSDMDTAIRRRRSTDPASPSLIRTSMHVGKDAVKNETPISSQLDTEHSRSLASSDSWETCASYSSDANSIVKSQDPHTLEEGRIFEADSVHNQRSFPQKLPIGLPSTKQGTYYVNEWPISPTRVPEAWARLKTKRSVSEPQPKGKEDEDLMRGRLESCEKQRELS